jgi:AcrR family transcriptional regulator
MALTRVKEGRDGLIEATYRVLDRDGVEAVTLRAVGKEARVSAPALYWHFENKEELLTTITREIATQFVQRVRAAAAKSSDAESLLAVGGAFIDFVIEHPHRFQLLFRQPLARANKPLHKTPPANTSFGVMVELIKRGITAGTLRLENPTSVALTVAALAQGLVVLNERNRFANHEEFAAFARDSFQRLLRGIATSTD